MLNAQDRIHALAAAEHVEYRRHLFTMFPLNVGRPARQRKARKIRNAVRYYRRYLRGSK